MKVFSYKTETRLKAKSDIFGVVEACRRKLVHGRIGDMSFVHLSS
jgi:hypothetical protein